MKNFFLIYVILFWSCGSHKKLQTEIYKGREILVGKTDRKAFQQKYYNEWFDANYRDYRTNGEVLKKLRQKINQYDIKIVMGTWCGDSRLYVPLLYKVLDEADYEKEPVVYCVPRDYKNYKPVSKDNIIRVPTIIVLKGKKEVGRIIEYPMQSIEEDLWQIIKGNYKHELQN